MGWKRFYLEKGRLVVLNEMFGIDDVRSST